MFDWSLRRKVIESQPFTGKFSNRQKLEIFPGIVNDAKYSFLIKKIADMAQPAALHKLGTNMSSLYTQPGYCMNPAGSVTMIKDAKQPSDSFLKILRKVAKMMFDRVELGPMSLNKHSSVGYPFYTANPITKGAILTFIKKNITKIAKAWEKYDFATLDAMDIPVLPGYDIGYRKHNTDTTTVTNGIRIAKPRNAFTFEGKEVQADKSLPAGFAQGVFAMRTRVYWKLNWITNIILNFAANAIRRAMKHDWKVLFWHDNPFVEIPKIAKKGWISASIDVNRFDTRQHKTIITTVVSALEECGAARWFINLLTCCLTAPVVYGSDVVGKKGLKILGDLANPLLGAEDRDYGCPSGIAFVDIFNKIFMVSILVYISIKAGIIKDDESAISVLLLGDHHLITLKNQGDDCACFFANEEVSKLFENAAKLVSDEVCPLEFTRETVWLGHSLTTEVNGIHRALPLLNNGIANLWIPERGVDHYSRRLTWAIGYVARDKDVYNNHPLYADLKAECVRLTNDHYSDIGFNLERLVEHDLGLATEELQRRLDKERKGEITRWSTVELFSRLTQNDRDFLANPDIIHYKLLVEEVTPEVVEMTYNLVPTEDVEYICGFIFNQVAKESRHE